jgi:hypothetical protein
VAWRSFAQGRWRGLWTQVSPYASTDDAHLALQAVTYPGSFLSNLSSRVKKIAEPRLLMDLDIPGADESLAIEQDTDGPKGPATFIVTAGVVDSTVFVCAFFGETTWPWTEVGAIAARQARGIKKCQNL